MMPSSRRYIRETCCIAGLSATLLLAIAGQSPVVKAAETNESLSTAAAPPSKRQSGPTCEIEGGEEHSVVGVLDGQTLRLVGGREVRLAGALAPSPFDAAAEAGNWPPAVAARQALERLVQGRSIRVVAAGRRSDRYGRLLAQAFLGSGEGAVWIQGEILKAGYARAYGLDGSRSCSAQLLACEAIARDARLGLWAEAAYQVRSADEVRGLLGVVGTFQLVEGAIVSVSGVRSAISINFGGDWRSDFTISVRGSVRRDALKQWTDLAALNGRRLRVRGWIEQRGGPLIDIQDVADIEWLDGEASGDRGRAGDDGGPQAHR
jgi:micrococcal nuclease